MVTGPIYGGYIVQNIGWRWTIWVEAILVSELDPVVLDESLIWLGRYHRDCFPDILAGDIRTHTAPAKGEATPKRDWTSVSHSVRPG